MKEKYGSVTIRINGEDGGYVCPIWTKKDYNLIYKLVKKLNEKHSPKVFKTDIRKKFINSLRSINGYLREKDN